MALAQVVSPGWIKAGTMALEQLSGHSARPSESVRVGSDRVRVPEPGDDRCARGTGGAFGSSHGSLANLYGVHAYTSAGCLVAEITEYVRRQRSVVRFSGGTKGCKEVSLRQTVLTRVESHPTCSLAKLA